MLKHATRNQDTWTTRTVDSAAQPGTSIVIGNQDMPVIAYRKNGVRLARLVADSWTLETIDAETRQGQTISLAWDAASGREHLVYADQGFDDLVYATWGPAWQQRTVGTGDRASLIVRNGQPQIVLRKDDGPSSLVLSTGMEGSVWNEDFIRHAQEITTIARRDPGLVWDGYRTSHNFMPGLEAWATGRGDEIPVTQEMVNQALAMWQRIVGAASPELAAVINKELADTHQLQDFVGRSFDDWAQDIGVSSPATQLYFPTVRK